MPVITSLYGIIIRMNCGDHNPGHFHAEYKDWNASFSLDGEIMTGEMPGKQARQIKVWAELHQDELEALWKLAQREEPLFKVEPLK